MVDVVSPLPAALDALLQALTLAFPDDVLIVDGPPVKTDAPDMVMVGFTGEPGGEAITITRGPADYARRSDRETYDIVCLASSWRGGTDLKDVRDRAFGFIALISSELKRDRTIGGTVERAQLTLAGVSPLQASNGVRCTVRFTVHVDACTR
jgi:hypothetical protein